MQLYCSLFLKVFHWTAAFEITALLHRKPNKFFDIKTILWNNEYCLITGFEYGAQRMNQSRIRNWFQFDAHFNVLLVSKLLRYIIFILERSIKCMYTQFVKFLTLFLYNLMAKKIQNFTNCVHNTTVKIAVTSITPWNQTTLELSVFYSDGKCHAIAHTFLIQKHNK